MIKVWAASVVGGFGLALMGGIAYFVIEDVFGNKKINKRREEIKKEVKLNKLLNNLEEAIMEYPYSDKVNKKLESLSEEIDELQEILDRRKIKDEDFIKSMNMKIEVMIQSVAKFSELENEKERAIKPIVLDMIKKLTKEVREKTKTMTNEDVENEKMKFREKEALLEKL